LRRRGGGLNVRRDFPGESSMKLIRLAALIVSMLAVATTADAQMRGRRGGQEEKDPNAPSPFAKREKQFPVPSSWVIVSLNGKPYGGVDRPTFTLDQQFRAKGFGGCNTYSATAYPLKEQHFAVGPLALTKKQCDKPVMGAEHTFFVAIRTAQQWDLDGLNLVIKGPNGELRFERSI
jgi:heat shock protein HslJ